MSNQDWVPEEYKNEKYKYMSVASWGPTIYSGPIKPEKTYLVPLKREEISNYSIITSDMVGKNIEVDGGTSYDGPEIAIVTYGEKVNESYDAQMLKYNSELEIYNSEKAIFKKLEKAYKTYKSNSDKANKIALYEKLKKEFGDA